MTNVYSYYGTQVCLRNKQNGKYMGFCQQSQSIVCRYPPSSIQVTRQSHQLNTDCTIVFKIVPRDEQKQKTILQGSRVFLIANGKDYLTCTSKGQLRFDQPSSSADMNKLMHQASTWTVQLYRLHRVVTPSGQSMLTTYDDVLFKSNNNLFISMKDNLQCVTGEEAHPQRSVWNIIKADEPCIPAWIYQKPAFCKHLNLEMRRNNGTVGETRQLRSHLPEAQQILLVQDLLDVMLGYDGTYIKLKAGTFTFVIEPSLESPSCSVAWTQLVSKILVLPSYYLMVENYIAKYQIQKGIICQSLCGALRYLIKEYKLMVVQLDELTGKEGLGLQAMWYYIQKIMKIMESLVLLIREAQELKGGQLISCIARLINENTDEHVSQIYNFLFQKTMSLYIQMVSKWIYEGNVDDRHGEFMIMVDETAGEWTEWNEKYTLRNDQVPTIFQKDSHVMLITGKYLNILKVCNKTINHPFTRELQDHLDSHIRAQNFTETIARAYDWANQQIKLLFMNECKLQAVLKSIKGYFFMEFGDLFVHFMESFEADLLLPKKAKSFEERTFSQAKMQNLFELLVRTSSANSDPYKEDISCRIDNSTLYQQVQRIKTLESGQFSFDYGERPYVKKDSKYLQFVTLDFRCSFPLNLVINKRNLLKYQVLFRLIFWCKFIERQLNSVWLSLQATKEVPLKCYRYAYLLNQRMINYIKNFIYYLCYEVIEQNWLHFMDNLKKAQNLEEIMHFHNSFLNKCLTESLLVSSKLLPIVTVNLGNACHGYFQLRKYLNCIYEEKAIIHSELPREQFSNALELRKVLLNKLKDVVQTSLQQQNFVQFVGNFSSAFDAAMTLFLKEIYSMTSKNDGYLVRLVERIDEMKYYSKRLFRSGNGDSFIR